MKYYPGDRGGGTPNPLADEPCGAVDSAAKFPELVHYDCRECRRIVTFILSLRVPPKPPEKIAVALPLFGDLPHPRKLRK